MAGLRRWEIFADAVLHRAAHERRWRWGQGFDPLAGRWWTTPMWIVCYDGLRRAHLHMRRIHVAVEFPLPEEAERLAIWQASFPTTAPLGEIDFAFLAERFKLSGGSIRTAALSAAFAAADAEQPVSMIHAMHGVRREYQKLGRIVTPGEFGRWFDVSTKVQG